MDTGAREPWGTWIEAACEHCKGKGELPMIMITLNDGETWIPCPNGLRVNIDDRLLPGEETKGDLEFNFTNEGVILDLWEFIPENTVEEENVGTSSETYEQIVCRLVSENE